MASLASEFLETLNDALASRIFTRRAVDWATVMPRLRVTTTTPASLKLALSAATASAFCERSMPYSFTCDRTGIARKGLAPGDRLRCPLRKSGAGESVRWGRSSAETPVTPRSQGVWAENLCPRLG